jgi:hypothetical protein
MYTVVVEKLDREMYTVVVEKLDRQRNVHSCGGETGQTEKCTQLWWRNWADREMYTFIMEKLDRQRMLGRSRKRWKNNNKRILRK